MAKKKKHKRFIDDYDWQEEPDVADLDPQPEVEKVSLEDFVVLEKVQAFCRAYAPCNELDEGYEQFNDAQLRQLFKATVCGLGDPLKIYIEELKLGGFHMAMSMATGEPCIFARRKD